MIEDFSIFTGVYDTSGAPWAANIDANFEKIWNDPNIILRGLGETDSWITWSRKFRRTAPLQTHILIV
jgi:hypothetical protein